MTDEKRREALPEAEQLLPYTWRRQPDYEAVLSDVAAALASRNAEIERLRSDYNTTISYNIDERAKLASLLKEKDAEIERLKAECTRTAQPAADDVERARNILERFEAGEGQSDTEWGPDKLAIDIATALTAARQDARRQALEEAAQVAKDAADFTSGMDIQFVSPASFAAGLALDISDNIIALADKPAATSPDIISLLPRVRAYRRAVEASPVSNVLDLQEWRDLCAAMNAIDAAEGAR